MGRLIATIKYGSARTRLFLLAVFILVAGGLGLAIFGGVSYSLGALAAGAAALIVGLVMIFMANFSVTDVDSDEDDEDAAGDGSGRKHGAGENATAAINERDGRANADKQRTRRDESKRTVTDIGADEASAGSAANTRRKDASTGTAANSDTDDAPTGTVADIGEGSGSAKDRRISGDSDPDIPAEIVDIEFADGGYEDVSAEKEDTRKRKKGRRKKKQEGVNEPLHEKPQEREQRLNNEGLDRFTPVVYKQMLHRYKVKKDYINIVIDDAQKFDTARTPALCWVKKKDAFFLLIEGNERVVSMPYERFLKVTYSPNVREENMDAYNRLRKDMGIYEQFEEVMPAFSGQTGRLGQTVYTKNRYILGGTVAVTPRSLKALRKKHKFDIQLFDALGLEGDYSLYFRRAYEARVLWNDQVIGQQEYQNMVGALLQQMVDDKSLVRYDFLDNLEQMVDNRLITDEYADYYMQQWKKKNRS